MNALETAFNALDEAAVHWSANRGEIKAVERLTAAAREYGRAYWASRTGSNGRSSNKPSTSTTVLKLGRSKGKTVGEASSDDLRWVSKFVGESLADPKKNHYRADNLKLIEAIEAELRNRGDL